jgi:hypothetical protein
VEFGLIFPLIQVIVQYQFALLGGEGLETFEQAVVAVAHVRRASRAFGDFVGRDLLSPPPLTNNVAGDPVKITFLLPDVFILNLR